MSITCPRCHVESHNHNDVLRRYCGNCHKFHNDAHEAQAQATAELAAVTLQFRTERDEARAEVERLRPLCVKAADVIERQCLMLVGHDAGESCAECGAAAALRAEGERDG